jgi:hypothetical protein
VKRESLSLLVGCFIGTLGVACGDDEEPTSPVDGGRDASVATSDGGGPVDAGAPVPSSDAAAASGDAARTTSPLMSFFVTSRTGSGNLGGLPGADAICEQLAAAVGQGDKTWVAYLSTTNPMESARDRIGEGPWYNAAGVKIAETSAELHQLHPPLWPVNDRSIALTERGERVPGPEDRPTPNEHDIITGTNLDGTPHMDNCNNWTSEGPEHKARVGHHDRRGPMIDQRNEWNGSHESAGCAASRTGGIGSGGGAGRFYCFAKK